MCRLYRLLYNIIPLKKAKAFIIKKHFERCPHCREKIPADAELERLLSVSSWIEEEQSLWPGIKTGILEEGKSRAFHEEKPRRFRLMMLRWAAAGLVLAAVFALNFWLHKDFPGSQSPAESGGRENIPKISIKFAEVNGEKAKPYVYRTSKTSFIWFAKINGNGG
ncbi:MAG: hypothetical protein JXB26_17825 [Candidatus Aminicenantes bacterium]|nr:hypothetical protein [Candidatus Aminicenantes bacterium]